ncbi:TPA: hypothetical protein OO286_002821, partial [Shigella flexneri]|nr:hypothetical protein [Shigella flexneri]
SYSEAAMLAVLPQVPSRLRPDRWPERAEAARRPTGMENGHQLWLS